MILTLLRLGTYRILLLFCPESEQLKDLSKVFWYQFCLLSFSHRPIGLIISRSISFFQARHSLKTLQLQYSFACQYAFQNRC